MGAQDEGRTTRIGLGSAGSFPRAPRPAPRRGPARTPAADGATTSVIRHDVPRVDPPRADRAGTPDGAARPVARAVAPATPPVARPAGPGRPDRPARPDGSARPDRPARPGRADSGTTGHSATRWLRYADPTSAGTPVFVDGSGRRRTFWRVVGVLVVAACLVFLAVLVAAAVAGSPGAANGLPLTTGAVSGSSPPDAGR